MSLSNCITVIWSRFKGIIAMELYALAVILTKVVTDDTGGI